MGENSFFSFCCGFVVAILILVIIKVSLYGWDATYCG